MEESSAAFARTLACADADARFRRALLQRKCEEMERVLRVLEGKAARRQEAAGGRQEARPTRDQRTAEVGQSIQDAIDRARRVRDEMKGRIEAESESDDDKEATEEQHAADDTLQEILNMARSIRGTQPTSGTQTPHEAQAISEAVTEESPPPRATRLHLEYPHKLKFLVEQLQDKRDDPFRFAFCCKVNKHLSMSAARRKALEEATGAEQTRLDAPVARIQVPFPKQTERLARAYARLAAFLDDKLAVDSIEFQRAMQSPTLPRLFPFCARLKLVRTRC